MEHKSKGYIKRHKNLLEVTSRNLGHTNSTGNFQLFTCIFHCGQLSFIFILFLPNSDCLRPSSSLSQSLRRAPSRSMLFISPLQTFIYSLNIHYVPPGRWWQGDKWRQEKVKSLRCWRQNSQDTLMDRVRCVCENNGGITDDFWFS